ncbi:MAG: hypothetical protein ACRC1T_05580 [Clostridium chrysemydis]|uniref:hypothetical protein n=1 Tax=Clostridium chrysemydis TaxID=2665504 RepID=UPI003F2F08B3
MMNKCLYLKNREWCKKGEFMDRDRALKILSDLQEYNKELSDYELTEILNIYNEVIHRIENRSNKYKCPYCGEYLIKSYEHIYESGAKREEYKCFKHYYTYEITIENKED